MLHKFHFNDHNSQLVIILDFTPTISTASSSSLDAHSFDEESEVFLHEDALLVDINFCLYINHQIIVEILMKYSSKIVKLSEKVC